MGFNRPEAKYRARMAMRGAYPHPMLVTLVYLLLTSGVTAALTYAVANPFMIGYIYLLDGEAAQDVFRYIFTPGRVGVYLLVQLLLTLYIWVMDYGYTAYGLRLARRQNNGYQTLFTGFSCMGRALLVSFLISLFVTLWGLLFMIPGIVLLSVGAVMESYGLIYLSVLLLFVAAILEVAVSYRYRLAIYFLLDHPEMGVLEAISASKQAMQGRKGELFIMDLSFLGWLILSALTLGILGLWVTPYMWSSEANFYHWAVYGCFPGDRPGGDWSGGQPNDQGGGQGSGYQRMY